MVGISFLHLNQAITLLLSWLYFVLAPGRYFPFQPKVLCLFMQGQEVGLQLGYNFLVLTLGRSSIPGHTGPLLMIWTKRETYQTENAGAKVLRPCVTHALQLSFVILKRSLASCITMLDLIQSISSLVSCSASTASNFQLSVQHVRYESRQLLRGHDNQKI